MFLQKLLGSRKKAPKLPKGIGLTNAVTPCGEDAGVQLEEGYRRDDYQDRHSGLEIPVVIVAVKEDRLMDIFLSCMRFLTQQGAATVDVILENSFESSSSRVHVDHCCEEHDTICLMSKLQEFEDLLVYDGCTGIALVAQEADNETPYELQFDEHKMIVFYAGDQEAFCEMLEDEGVLHNPNIHFVSEGEHVHGSSEELKLRFDELRDSLSSEF